MDGQWPREKSTTSSMRRSWAVSLGRRAWDFRLNLTHISPRSFNFTSINLTQLKCNFGEVSKWYLQILWSCSLKTLAVLFRNYSQNPFDISETHFASLPKHHDRPESSAIQSVSSVSVRRWRANSLFFDRPPFRLFCLTHSVTARNVCTFHSSSFFLWVARWLSSRVPRHWEGRDLIPP